mmetsp:Transcript_9966/g.24140  ORF Transcript_9966/g.24140 Transcript_9966/m.24140 type:complete len:507 (+) Transcript_9966:532-2052(+)
MNPNSSLAESSPTATGIGTADKVVEEKAMVVTMDQSQPRSQSKNNNSSSISSNHNSNSSSSTTPQKKKKRKKTAFLGNFAAKPRDSLAISKAQKPTTTTTTKPPSDTSLCPTVLIEHDDGSSDLTSTVIRNQAAVEDETSAGAAPQQPEEAPRDKVPFTVEEEHQPVNDFEVRQKSRPKPQEPSSSSCRPLYDDSTDDEEPPVTMPRNKEEGRVLEEIVDETSSSVRAASRAALLYNDSDDSLPKAAASTTAAAQSMSTGSSSVVDHVKMQPVVPEEKEEEKDEEVEGISLEQVAATAVLDHTKPIASADSTRTKVLKSILKWKDHVEWTNNGPSTSSADRLDDDRRERASVKYGEVQIRYHFMDLGDNPTCSIGAPVALSWDFEQADRIDLDIYEFERKPRRRLRHMILNYYQRQDILRRAGYSDEEISNAAKSLHKVKRQRSQTQMMLPVSKLEEAWQSAGRKILRFGGSKKDKQQQGGGKAPRRLSGSSAASGSSSASSRASR